MTTQGLEGFLEGHWDLFYRFNAELTCAACGRADL